MKVVESLLRETRICITQMNIQLILNDSKAGAIYI